VATTTERGLGWTHQQRREQLLEQHIDGMLCGECRQPMWRDLQALDADHSLPRSLGGTQADRLLHRSCNRRRGNGTGGAEEPIKTVTSRNWRRKI
jgi:5-methylcytosine-specific restriction endonuclease McrA